MGRKNKKSKVVFIDVDGPNKHGMLSAAVVSQTGQKIFKGTACPEQMTEILETKTSDKVIGGHNVQCDLSRLTHNIAYKGTIDTQNLGSIFHSSNKHDPVEDARGSQQLAKEHGLI
ncbi:Oidioi.mRNA.OKI2018_I69.chr2.g8199.t1.cds [Oikopleura dioica]|uniref:Oidioi.mRNA.OKI2018_I69.chr2.g8199.t1.cds n=1 Tax=Oikopleura dioica TaxID=34765 RepID=A0ABN7T9I7_OIKDI|nr:Oidioi.mRNA.OKI2018_I69.chr2.g8199.t1.cds [Oikopleura dioica]